MYEGSEVKLHLTEGPELETIYVDMGDDRIDPMDKYNNAWEPSVFTKIDELKPDIMVVDIISRPGHVAAEKFGIPLVVNNPAGPYRFYQDIFMEKTIHYPT